MAARRRCRECGTDAGYCLPRATGTCWPCEQKTPNEPAPASNDLPVYDDIASTFAALAA